VKLLEQLRDEKNMRLKGGLYHQTQVQFAYNTNRIEGSRLSEEQTRYIYETNTIHTAPDEAADVDDIVETTNHFTCFDYMLDCADELLAEEMIKEFHRLLKSNTSDAKKAWFHVGDYKERPNMVGDMQTTLPANVKAEMSVLLNDYNNATKSFESIVEFHFEFERIHPFQDGNGRVGRIIMFKECLANGIIPFVIPDEHKLFYYRGLREFNSEPGFLLDTCRTAQDRYMKLVEYFYP